ncbi:PhzF family phenazine biosynthesis protein [Alteromonas sp. 5E99-2]|uniref:PhzF family phenazine biosynthesis protein n=1 Tax=Alteromonas sp. 5E99-2 TaxID=2817683 RepID=UPI001A98B042|nr:PhzF family phenazine biosynthesis protein [Alteromonas sp. 5E99-2]MBO1256211.1 PhzF family phenazine biosynthesis protein [Alteromonas sp. 5E99-2]
MKYKFYTCDVFTDVRFGGNPLAVLPNAEGLSSKQMQKIAREFNYSESTFVFPSKNGCSKNVRIFTPTHEVPFAGHPNIGTAFTLAKIGELGSIDGELSIVFEEKAGQVPITIRKTSSGIWCELKAPESLSIGKSVSIDLIASALSLEPEDIVTKIHQPVVASVGLPFIIVELKNRTVLESARSYIPAIDEINSKGIRPDILVYIRSDDEFDIRARMFAPQDNVPEDPATGSANCALVAMLSHYKIDTQGEANWRIAQGVEMNRPSVLDARTKNIQMGLSTYGLLELARW